MKLITKAKITTVIISVLIGLALSSCTPEPLTIKESCECEWVDENGKPLYRRIDAVTGQITRTVTILSDCDDDGKVTEYGILRCNKI